MKTDMESTAEAQTSRLPAAASAAFFVLAASLGFLVSGLWFFLLLPAVALSTFTLPKLHAQAAERTSKLGQTGAVMVFNGIVLILAVFVVGFIRDFLQAHPATLDESVALVFTTVHMMLGVGLFLLDYRGRRTAQA